MVHTFFGCILMSASATDACLFSRPMFRLAVWLLEIRCSFGGVVLLKLMEELANDENADDKEDKAESDAAGGTGIRAAMAGGAFLCSVPPSGNGPMTKRFIKEVHYGKGRSCLVCYGASQSWHGIVEVLGTRDDFGLYGKERRERGTTVCIRALLYLCTQF